MLYHEVINLETAWRNFNQQQFTSSELIEIAEDNGIITLPDFSIKKACAFNHQNRNFIFYNPHQPESEITLTLGHEMGHFGLGHVQPDADPLYANYFDCSKNERDAGIVGFLFWLSTPVLRRMEAEGRLDLEQVYNYCRNNIDWETPDKDMIKMCHSRLRIYNALKRIKRHYFVDKGWSQQSTQIP